ncbi:MAG: protein kinase, partial [Nannocystaceae bacterium]|nr:protein kinase [Nannocystaceae bacterium]
MAGSGEEFGPCSFCGKLHAEDILLCQDSEKLLPLEGRILDGKFRFVRQLGEGGMGVVWRAENILVKKDVAIKLMHVQFSRDEGVLARFRNEATAAGRIGSEHVCDILDLGKSMLGPYIVMEMLQGKDLANFLREKRGQVDPGLSVLIVREALVGLQAAHNAGIVHRDLKPENIFLHEPKPGRLMVKLMDFGISKFTEGSEAGKTGMGVLMGTPEYMSPEQTEGAAQVDHRTDIWAMGVILYWAVTGRNPFSGPTLAATLINVSTKPPPPLSQVAPHVDPGLVAIIDRCILKAPAGRYDSCDELAAALLPYEKQDNGIYRTMSEAPRAISRPGATMASAPSSPAPGATVASQYTPVPTAGTPPPGAPTFGTPPGPGAAQTWSGGMTGGPPGSAPTLGAAGGFGLSERELDSRPDSNIGGGKSTMLILVLLLVAGLGVGGYFVYANMQAGKSTVAAADSGGDKSDDGADADADDGKAETAAAVAGTGGADSAASGTGGAVSESGAKDDAGSDGKATGGAVDDGAATGGAADDGKSDSGAVDGGAADGGAADDGADDGGKFDSGAADDGTGDDGAADDGKSDDGGAGDGGKSDDGGGGTKPKPNGPKFDKKKVKKAGKLFGMKKVGPRGVRSAAKSYCAKLGKYGGLKGWRMPTAGEAKRIRPPRPASGAVWVSDAGKVYNVGSRTAARAGPRR